MGHRLTKIYTRTGDAGTTGSADGSRVAKDDCLIHAIGDIDELNSQLAIVVCHLPAALCDQVKAIQNELFNVGGELTLGMAMINDSHVAQLEHALDTLNQHLPPLKEFILPGGGLAASHCHLARAICRRAERHLVSLNHRHKLNSLLMAYINRLSDYLFVLARAVSRMQGETEVYWQSKRLSSQK